MADRLLRTKEVCELLGCSHMQLWRLRFDERYKALGFPQPVGFDRYPRFKESEIRNFIECRQQKPLRAKTACEIEELNARP